jgi:hypothetical protein
MSSHIPRLCPNDGAPLTARGNCGRCGQTFGLQPSCPVHDPTPVELSPSATDVPAPATGHGHVASLTLDPLRELGGTFDIQVLDAIPEGASAVSLPAGVGRDVAGELAKLAGGALREMRKDTAYQLVPSKELQKGIAEKTLRYGASKNGDACVLVKDVKTGRIKGQAALKEVRANPAAMLGPAAWQALAMVTQQHFLSEIDARLEHIERRIDAILDRMRAQLDTKLESMIDEVERLHGRYEHGFLDSHDRAEIRRMLRDADAMRAEALRSFEAQAHANAGTIDPSANFADLESAYLAFRAQAQLAQLRVKTAPSQEAELVVEQERKRFLDALPEMQDVARRLLAHDRELREQQSKHDRARIEQGKIARTWDRTVGQKSKLLRRGQAPPEFPPLSLPRRQLVKALAEPVELQPRPLIVHAAANGEVALLTTG